VTLRALVIGLGQPAGGDDGVGIAVIVRLRAEGEVEDVAFETATDASALVERLQENVPVVVVDAVVGGGSVGDVLVVAPERLDGDARPLSTHGLSVAQAIALARAVAPESVSSMIRIVGVVIAPPERGSTSLSSEVAAAIPAAVTTVRTLLREAMN
jgi:hydrogenase maturation protease